MVNNDSNNGEYEEFEWEGDVLYRKKYSIFLTNFLKNKKEGCVVNINAPWGEGKTFFLEKWYKDLSKDHPAVFFNAWESDFSNEPLISVVSCINNQIIPFLSKKDQYSGVRRNLISKTTNFLKKAAPIAVKGGVGKVIGQEGAEALFEMSSEDEKTIAGITSKLTEEIIKSNQDAENSIKDFKRSISALIEKVEDNGYKAPLFIFIDELDRCRPLYAIELLERIKHLFGIPKVIFIVATDTQQLSCSVKAIYGESFKGDLYLRRFFDQIFTLPKPSSLDFPKLLFSKFKSNNNLFNYAINFLNPSDCLGVRNNENAALILLFTLFSNFFDLDLRTQQQCYDRFIAIYSSLDNRKEIHFAYLIFLITLDARSQEIFNEYFSDPDINNKIDILNKFTGSNLCLKVMKAKLKAIDFIAIYTRHLFIEKKELEEIIDKINDSQNNTEENIIRDIFLYNKDHLLEYKEMVQMSAFLDKKANS